MNRGIQRRLVRAETAVSERRQRTRERIERVALRLGAQLSAREMDEITEWHMGTPTRIRALHRAGLTEDRILERLVQESEGDAR